MQHLLALPYQDQPASPSVSPAPTTTVTVAPSTSSAPTSVPSTGTTSPTVPSEVPPAPFSEEAGGQLLDQVKVLQATVDELNAPPAETVTLDTDQFAAVMLALGVVVLLLAFSAVMGMRR